MRNKRILGIDDCRELSYCQVLCRTYKDGVAALQHMGPWDELHLDHDLGAIEPQFNQHGGEYTGYSILCFLEENPQFLPKKVVLVTGNPSGRVRMEQLLKKLYPDGQHEQDE